MHVIEVKTCFKAKLCSKQKFSFLSLEMCWKCCFILSPGLNDLGLVLSIKVNMQGRTFRHLLQFILAVFFHLLVPWLSWHG